MTVRTTADEQLDIAREHISKAISALVDIVIEECHGTYEFNKTFRGTMRACLNGLMDIREDLK